MSKNPIDRYKTTSVYPSVHKAAVLGGVVCEIKLPSHGISIYEEFVKAAMQGICSGLGHNALVFGTDDMVAEAAVRTAEATLSRMAEDADARARAAHPPTAATGSAVDKISAPPEPA